MHFSPKGGAAAAIIRSIREAKSSILVQAYSFTYAPIAEALADATRRGVKVVVLLDSNEPEEKHSVASYLVRYNVGVMVDGKHAKAHNKVMILDGETVITGSFNFIRDSEEENAENLLVLKSKELAEQYTQNWQYHASHSKEYNP